MSVSEDCPVPVWNLRCWTCQHLQPVYFSNPKHYTCPKNRKIGPYEPRDFAEKCSCYDKIQPDLPTMEAKLRKGLPEKGCIHP